MRSPLKSPKGETTTSWIFPKKENSSKFGRIARCRRFHLGDFEGHQKYPHFLKLSLELIKKKIPNI